MYTDEYNLKEWLLSLLPTLSSSLQEQLKKNKRFRRFVRLQEGRPEFGSLHLQDLLPLPLQRLQQ